VSYFWAKRGRFAGLPAQAEGSGDRPAALTGSIWTRGRAPLCALTRVVARITGVAGVVALVVEHARRARVAVARPRAHALTIVVRTEVGREVTQWADVARPTRRGAVRTHGASTERAGTCALRLTGCKAVVAVAARDAVIPCQRARCRIMWVVEAGATGAADGRADGSGVAAAGTAGRAGRCADDAVDCVPRAAFGAA
jgi:hypothetical protein